MVIARKFRLVPVSLLTIGLACLGAGGCGAEGGNSDRDRAFLEAMVPHHEAAIWMAQLAEPRSESPGILRLARGIRRAQDREIEQMRRIHQRLYGETLAADPMAHEVLGLSASEAGMNHTGSAGADHSGTGHPASGDHTMKHSPSLATARAFDPAFVEEMIPHHRGAVAMAGALLETTDDSELRSLARRIIRVQNREIALMENLRSGFRGAPDPSR